MGVVMPLTSRALPKLQAEARLGKLPGPGRTSGLPRGQTPGELEGKTLGRPDGHKIVLPGGIPARLPGGKEGREFGAGSTMGE